MQGTVFEDPLDAFEFEAKIQNGAATPYTEGHFWYSFKTFGTVGTPHVCPNPVDAVPESGISMALRIVNHLQGTEIASLSLPDTLEFKLNETDNLITIRAAIERNVKSLTHAQWELQLWVLPQTPNGKTLYRYKKGVSGLHSFLDQTELDNEHMSLFAEAHVVPTTIPEKITRSGRNIKSVQRD